MRVPDAKTVTLGEKAAADDGYRDRTKLSLQTAIRVHHGPKLSKRSGNRSSLQARTSTSIFNRGDAREGHSCASLRDS